MAKNKTIFQRLGDVVVGLGNGSMSDDKRIVNYAIAPQKKVIAQYDTKEERNHDLLQMKQDRLLAYQWKKIGYESTVTYMTGTNLVRVMYRDADLMALWPEIGSALKIISEEATTIDSKGKILHVYSKSERIKSVLEDLFDNRLDCKCMLQMIAHSVAKYGNSFVQLNIDSKNGITGWRELDVHTMTRLENGCTSPYGAYNANAYQVDGNISPNDVRFVMDGHTEQMPFQNWQIAHFRLMNDSLFSPYGVSWLNPARRHWRMLSMMEDGMLLYRLERSVERRIFKVNVGLIDDNDVEQFLQQFLNNVKRSPVIDPETGQIDLRKNFLDVSADYVIPVRPGQDPTSIETLQSATNQTSMEDIQYMENKILACLRVPKSFLNYQESQGKGQNLSMMDIRFCRTVNTLQQALLMELNKVAIIHLYLLGFQDDLTNFTLSLNNPSNQIEAMEIENLTKRITAASAALAEQGGGLPLMSWHQVQKEIMGRSDKEIANMLNEIRIESALATERQMTSQIIKRTGLFDKADRIYGEPGAEYQQAEGDNGDGGFGEGGGMPSIGGFGDDLGDIGEPGGETDGFIGGSEESEPMDTGEETLQEQIENILDDFGKKTFFKTYLKHINKDEYEEKKRPEIINKNILINENLTNTIKRLNELKENNELEDLLSNEKQFNVLKENVELDELLENE